jgi:hypothetical protein
MNRQPFIVGVMADKVLGFLVGLWGSVLGLLATILVMFMWAGSERTPEVDARRQHAQSVSIWSGIGCAIPTILVIIAVLLVLTATGPAYHSDVTPIVLP